MKGLNYSINDVKICCKERIIFNVNNYIDRILCEKRGVLFCDIVLTKGDKKILIGRFDRVDFEVKVAYYKQKILVYKDEFDKKSNSMKIINVLSLYDIKEDMFYCCTALEALKTFDILLDSSKLLNKEKLIYRSDVEKVKRLNKK